MLEKWLDHVSLLLRVTSKYFACVTSLITVFWITYGKNKMLCLFEILINSHFAELNDIFHL